MIEGGVLVMVLGKLVRRWMMNLGLLGCIFCLCFIGQSLLLDNQTSTSIPFLLFSGFCSITFAGVLLAFQVEILPVEFLPLTMLLPHILIVVQIVKFDVIGPLCFGFLWMILLFVVFLFYFVWFYAINVETNEKECSQILNEFMKKRSSLSLRQVLGDRKSVV